MLKKKSENKLYQQAIPLSLTVVVFAILSLIIYVEVRISNTYTAVDIITKIRFQDVLIGMTIYLKTAVDFAIFIGNLMAVYPSWKNRIAIEIGTAVGNAMGTIIVLLIWNVFREVKLILAIMIFVASLVLFKLAEDGMEHVRDGSTVLPQWFLNISEKFEYMLVAINRLTNPILKFIIPNLSMKPKIGLNFWGLMWLSFTIPFILGLDDFAGYVPLFNIINVFGFTIGVLFGHMVLNILLFLSPIKTITAVKNPAIAFIGSVAFVGLAILGLHEVVKILLH